MDDDQGCEGTECIDRLILSPKGLHQSIQYSKNRVDIVRYETKT